MISDLEKCPYCGFFHYRNTTCLNGTGNFSVDLPGKCHYCGQFHTGMCDRIKSIEYYQDGTIKRIEFHPSYGQIPWQDTSASEEYGLQQPDTQL